MQNLCDVYGRIHESKAIALGNVKIRTSVESKRYNLGLPIPVVGLTSQEYLLLKGAAEIWCNNKVRLSGNVVGLDQECRKSAYTNSYVYVRTSVQQKLYFGGMPITNVQTVCH